MREAAEAIGTLFEPDVVLPSQFNQGRDEGINGGERKLMAALLSDGIEAYISLATTDMRRPSPKWIEVRDWVEDSDNSYIFSFDVVCECLGIDPSYLRLGLRRYVEHVKVERAAGRAPRLVWKKIRRPRK
ncbi:MAG: hypothetical protein KDD44_01205 [Bdellovibrionales bacterium]|nr:hypothetical protein [Bdellovibrionales bacterium]